jgi:AcrR family transcriptional regulator
MARRSEKVDPAPTRHARRREQTRARLVQAARTLFAGQGVENTRINEITDEADVGFGSFYNHFESKAAILEAVLMETVAARGTVDAVTAPLDDPAEAIAAAHRHFVRLARRDPEWARLVVRGNLGHDVVLAALGPFAERDIRRGVQRGRQSVGDERARPMAPGARCWASCGPSSTARRPRTPTSTTPRACSASSASP